MAEQSSKYNADFEKDKNGPEVFGYMEKSRQSKLREYIDQIANLEERTLENSCQKGKHLVRPIHTINIIFPSIPHTGFFIPSPNHCFSPVLSGLSSHGASHLLDCQTE